MYDVYEKREYLRFDYVPKTLTHVHHRKTLWKD